MSIETNPAKSIEALRPCVDALGQLYADARVMHWHVRGPMRDALHRIFGELYAMAAEHQDVLAERIVQLGERVLPAPVVAVVPDDSSGASLCKDAGVQIAFVLERLSAARLALNEIDDFDTFDAVTAASRDLKKIRTHILLHLG